MIYKEPIEMSCSDARGSKLFDFVQGGDEKMQEEILKKELYDLIAKMVKSQMKNRGTESEYQKMRQEYDAAKKNYAKYLYEEKNRRGR